MSEEATERADLQEELREQIRAELEEEYRQTLQAYDGQFAVTDEVTADWVLARIAEAKDEQQRLTDNYEKAYSGLERRIAYLHWRFDPELSAWVKGNLPATRKSLVLPHGTLGFRAGRESLEVWDEDKASEWARVNCPDALAIYVRVKKTPLIAHIKATGEEPPGCRLVKPDEVFYVK